ncbi:MAG: hypothetical protein IJS40_08705 [Synergistaceae bacterium]|nr:hypothetical protein [Synergistaceae bacterium]
MNDEIKLKFNKIYFRKEAELYGMDGYPKNRSKAIKAAILYHLPDNPEVMESLIMQANPNDKIVYGKKKLYASV